MPYKPLLVISAVLVVSGMLALGCIGNTEEGCTSADLCLCDGIGNCEETCADQDCVMACRGIGNCTFNCEGGG